MDRGWSQSMPTERIVLSISQRCSVQRRVSGPPEAGADASEPSGMVSPPCELAAGHRDYTRWGRYSSSSLRALAGLGRERRERWRRAARDPDPEVWRGAAVAVELPASLGERVGSI